VDSAHEPQRDLLTQQLVDVVEDRRVEVIEVQDVLLHQYHSPLDLFRPARFAPAACLVAAVEGVQHPMEQLIHSGECVEPFCEVDGMNGREGWVLK